MPNFNYIIVFFLIVDRKLFVTFGKGSTTLDSGNSRSIKGSKNGECSQRGGRKMHSYRRALCPGWSNYEAYHVIHQEHVSSNSALDGIQLSFLSWDPTILYYHRYLYVISRAGSQTITKLARRTSNARSTFFLQTFCALVKYLFLLPCGCSMVFTNVAHEGSVR